MGGIHTLALAGREFATGFLHAAQGAVHGVLVHHPTPSDISSSKTRSMVSDAVERSSAGHAKLISSVNNNLHGKKIHLDEESAHKLVGLIDKEGNESTIGAFHRSRAGEAGIFADAAGTVMNGAAAAASYAPARLESYLGYGAKDASGRSLSG